VTSGTVVFVDLQDQDDRLSMAFSHPVAAQGGAGNDTLFGGPVADDLRGDGGADTLDGGAGNDFLAGMADNDILVGGPGGDGFVGGPGFDIADYSMRTAPVTVTVGDASPDGASGEGDDVASDVEAVHGGSGGDRLVAGAAGMNLAGGTGSDNLIGGPGPDRIRAQDGEHDMIDCGGGDDYVWADFGQSNPWIGPVTPPPAFTLILDVTINCEVVYYAG
jgi:Ca2+-binding RTX toxin-like protein